MTDAAEKTTFFNMPGASVVMHDRPDDTDADRLLCGEVGSAIHQAYPGFDWYVDVPHGQRVVTVRNFTINGAGKWGFVMKRDQLVNVRKQSVMAAGELLERWNVSRRGVRFDEASEISSTTFFKEPQQ